MRAVPWTRFAMAIVLTTLLSSSSALAAPECSERDEMKILDVDLNVNGEHTVVPAGLALFGGDVVVNSTLGPWSLALPVSGEYGCSSSSIGTSMTGDVLVVERGECQFYEKAKLAQAAGAKGLIIVSRGEDFTTMTCAEDEKLDIVTMLVAGENGLAILDGANQSGASLTITLAEVLPKQFDFVASFALLLMAVVTISLGGVWSLKDKRHDISSKRDDDDIDEREETEHDHSQGIEINSYSAFYFVVLASVVLLILFYSMQHWIFVVMRGVFALASFEGLRVVFYSALTYRKARFHRSKVVLPFMGAVQTVSILASIGAALVVATWVIFEKATWSWMLQDILGLSFLVNVLRLVHLPNLQVGTLLLCCAMLYDIFWVYVQPHLFGQKSVMVTVARGGERGERLPMLFLFPRASGDGDFSMLGYGDVILPGLLVVYNLLFDNRKSDISETKYYYFFWSLFAYAVGMVLTFFALYFEVGGQGGQPALTYLVPTVCGTTCFLAWKHHNLGEMWTGFSEEYSAIPSESESIL